MVSAVYESGRKWAINAFRQAVWYHSADIVSLLIDEGIDPMLEPALLGHASMIFNKVNPFTLTFSTGPSLSQSRLDLMEC